jgi:multiple sugar transport system permease protein
MAFTGTASPLQAKKAVWGYLFLLPWLLGLLLFGAGPILASFVLSFTKYDIVSAPKFLGLQNYYDAFFKDPLFWPSLLRTFEYTVVVVPVGVIGSLCLALLLNRGKRGMNVFRTLFFLPSLTPAVAQALLWTWIFQPLVGPVNDFLRIFGIPGPGWLLSRHWALPSLILITLWASWGSNTMIIFLAGLQGVPQSLMDAASIDGAGRWTKFWHVTVPMISPTVLFNLVLGVIGALQVFTLAYVATQGGPSYATWFLALHIYKQAFSYLRLGYGAALAWVFTAILLLFTYIQLRLSRKWVYYEGGAE